MVGKSKTFLTNIEKTIWLWQTAIKLGHIHVTVSITFDLLVVIRGVYDTVLIVQGSDHVYNGQNEI